MPKLLPPAFEYKTDASQWLIFVSPSTTSALGQVKSFTWDTSKEQSSTRRVSDSKKYFSTQGVDVSGNLTIVQDTDNAEVSLFYAQASDAEAAQMIIVALLYDGEATSSTLIKTYTFLGFDVVKSSGGPGEGGSETEWSFDFVAYSAVAS